MPTAKKLPSGSWRCQVYSHTEDIYQPDGSVKKKRIYESFTCDVPGPKGKRLAEQMAADFAAKKEIKASGYNLPLGTAIDLYIENKAGVLSESTIIGYKTLSKNYFQDIGKITLGKLDNRAIQIWVSQISLKVSPKTVRNAHALLSATLELFSPDFRLKTTLPAKKKPDLYLPSDNDVRQLLEYTEGTELEKAVLLAAFGPLRRGEICALDNTDIVEDRVIVRKNMILGEDKQWHIKQPKTYSGYREIIFPKFIIDKISGTEGRIIKATPDQISKRFKRAIKAAGLPEFRFHDLRHYSASIMHAIGVKDQYIIARGGWASDSIMKSIYRGAISEETKNQTQLIISHFENMQHDIQHEKQKDR